MTRTASCACGKLTAACEGEPVRISICHCLDCQRRTGSAFGAAAFFPRKAVRTEGPCQVFERTADSGAFFAANHIRVMLWNIDSQDWNRKISAEQARQRVLSLMLLWRHGVILFHDIHPKAKVAIPWLLEQTRASGVQWVDCHGSAGAGGE